MSEDRYGTGGCASMLGAQRCIQRKIGAYVMQRSSIISARPRYLMPYLQHHRAQARMISVGNRRRLITVMAQAFWIDHSARRVEADINCFADFLNLAAAYELMQCSPAGLFVGCK